MIRVLFQSSLLQVALGELPHCDGFVMRSNNVSYMPQLPWVFPGTVRENILCSLPYNHERYTRVLKATTLDVVHLNYTISFDFFSLS